MHRVKKEVLTWNYFVVNSICQKCEVKRNNALVQACDLRATVLDMIGEDYNAYGTSVYDWSENDERTRTYIELRDGKAYEYIYTGNLEELQKNIQKMQIKQ